MQLTLAPVTPWNNYQHSDEFANVIAQDTLQDLILMGERLFSKTMDTIFARLQFSGPKFWEDTDRGNINIYYSEYQIIFYSAYPDSRYYFNE